MTDSKEAPPSLPLLSRQSSILVDKVRVLICSDATGSMGLFLETLRDVLEELGPMLSCMRLFMLYIHAVVFPKVEFAVGFYWDYDGNHYEPKTGGYRIPTAIFPYGTDMNSINRFIAEKANASGGGDFPEAQKTFFTEILENNMLDAHTIVIHYTDSIPHGAADGSNESENERIHFKKKGWSFKWSDICKRVSDTGAVVLTISNVGNIVGIDSVYRFGDYSRRRSCELSRDSIMSVTLKLIEQLLGFDTVTKLKLNSNFVLSFSEIGKRLGQSTRYFNSVISILENQLDKRGIVGALDIFCNKVTSEIWRCLSSLRTNERMKKLRDKLSKLANGNTDKHAQLQSLLEASFDRREAFNEKFEHLSGSIRVYRKSHSLQLAVRDLQDFFTIFDRQTVSAFLMLVQTMQEEIVDLDLDRSTLFADKAVVPIEIPNQIFFSVLTHLITPGFVASKRQSGMIALVCLHDFRTAARAQEYLSNIKGSWLNFSLQEEAVGGFQYPENLNPGFLHFALNNRQFFTHDELSVMNSFVNFHNIFWLKNMNVSHTLAVIPNKDMIRCTKFTCPQCKKVRPIHIKVDGMNICAFCVDIPDEKEEHKVDPASVPDIEHEACTVTCCSCLGIYVVCRPDRIRGKPKCHYCRNHLKSPLVKCQVCHNMHIIPDFKGSSFTCESCVDYGLKTCNVLTTVKNVISENNDIFPKLFGKKFDIIHEVVMKSQNVKPMQVFEPFARSGNINVFNEIKLVKPLNSEHLHCSKREVFNSKDIVDEISRKIVDVKQVIESDTCQLCFDIFPALQLRAICMRETCSGKVCLQCTYKWLEDVNAGSIVELAKCSCPFCRQHFGKEIVKFHPISSLIIPTSAAGDSLRNHMAWCCGCDNLKVYIQRACSAEVPNVKNFVCDDCYRDNLRREEEELNAAIIEAQELAEVEKIAHYAHLNEPDNPINRPGDKNYSKKMLDNRNEYNLAVNEFYKSSKTTLDKKNVDRAVVCKNCNGTSYKAVIIDGVPNRGCNHITCQFCGYHICAFPNCGAAYITASECYNHMGQNQSKHW